MDWKSWAFAGFFLAGALVQIFIEPQWGTSAEASARQAHHASADQSVIKKSRSSGGTSVPGGNRVMGGEPIT
jgi:hypothetical protein